MLKVTLIAVILSFRNVVLFLVVLLVIELTVEKFDNLFFI